MNLLNKLTKNKWVCKFLNLLQKEDRLLNSVNLEFLDELYEKSKISRRGKKKEFKMSTIFRLVVDGFRNKCTASTEIARFSQQTLIKAKHNLSRKISHDFISDFWIALQSDIKKIFQKLVKLAEMLGIFYSGLSQVLDGTDIPTRFKKDSGGKWNYDSTRKRHYFGYGLLISVDPISQLPISGFITDGKKVKKKECEELFDDVMIVPPSAIIADSEFDVIDFHENLMGKNIQLIVPYNPRNAKSPLPIKYRSESYGFSSKWMREEIFLRAEVEHTFSMLKEYFHLLDFHVRGRKKVETHLIFVMCMRLLYGIATYKIGKSPRQINHL